MASEKKSAFGRVLQRAVQVTGTSYAHLARTTGIDRSMLNDDYQTEGKTVPPKVKREAIARAMLLPVNLFEIPERVALKTLKAIEVGDLTPRWDLVWRQESNGVPSASGANRGAAVYENKRKKKRGSSGGH